VASSIEGFKLVDGGDGLSWIIFGAHVPSDASVHGSSLAEGVDGFARGGLLAAGAAGAALAGLRGAGGALGDELGGGDDAARVLGPGGDGQGEGLQRREGGEAPAGLLDGCLVAQPRLEPVVVVVSASASARVGGLGQEQLRGRGRLVERRLQQVLRVDAVAEAVVVAEPRRVAIRDVERRRDVVERAPAPAVGQVHVDARLRGRRVVVPQRVQLRGFPAVGVLPAQRGAPEKILQLRPVVRLPRGRGLHVVVRVRRGLHLLVARRPARIAREPRELVGREERVGLHAAI
jgi:hypothetical protein